jgi:hypothetical protein
MSALMETLKASMKDAMRAKDSVKLGLIRQVISDVNTAMTSGKERKEPTDLDVIATIKKNVGQKRETGAGYANLGRADEAAVCEAEAVILETFLPPQMSEDKIRELVTQIISEQNLPKEQKSMGKIMGALNSQYAGQFDNATASRIAKEMVTA